MSNSDKGDIKLQITFPKSSEDHRLQLVEINGSIFAMISSPLESNGPINLYCEDWSLILLAPIRSQVDVSISAINIICMNEIVSEQGIVKIHASHRLMKYAPAIKSPVDIKTTSNHGEFQFSEDPAAFLNFQLFHNLLSLVHDESSNATIEAQKKFMAALCVLAEKIEGKRENLNLQRVLEIWDIPMQKILNEGDRL